jgi:hypothetical protein
MTRKDVLILLTAILLALLTANGIFFIIGTTVFSNKTTVVPVSDKELGSTITTDDYVNVIRVPVDVELVKRNSGTTGYVYFWRVRLQKLGTTAYRAETFLRMNGTAEQFYSVIVDNNSTTDTDTDSIPTTSGIPDDGVYTLQFILVPDTQGASGTGVRIQLYDAKGDCICDLYEHWAIVVTSFKLLAFQYAGSTYVSRESRTSFGKVTHMVLDAAYISSTIVGLMDKDDAAVSKYRTFELGETPPAW